ncbi:MFS transporter [Candidatus Woesearchaeota archaeon]|nr:MFS transporter [Candidatus Woesearchaeota archaeon]
MNKLERLEYNSNIWKFYLFKFLMSMELTIAIFVLFILSNGLTMTQTMLLESIFTVMIFFTEIPSGGFADKYGRKTSIAIAMFAGSISFLIFGLGSTFFVFLIAQLLGGLMWSFKSGSDEAFLYDTLKVLKKEKLFSKIYGKTNSFEMFNYGALAFVSSTLAYLLGYRMLFYLTSIIFFIAGLFVLTFKEPPLEKHLQEKNYFNHLWKAIKFSFTHNWVFMLVIFGGFFGAVSHLMYFLIQPLYDGGTLKLLLGLGVCIYFVACSIGSYFSHYFIDKFKEKTLIIILILIQIVALIGMFLFSVYFSLLFLFVLSFLSGIRGVASSKMINHHTSSHHRATVISVGSMMKSIVYAVLAPILGYVTDIYTIGASFLMLSFGMFCLLIVILFMFIMIKD